MDDQNRKLGQISGVLKAEPAYGKEPGVFVISRSALSPNEGNYRQRTDLRTPLGKQKLASKGFE